MSEVRQVIARGSKSFFLASLIFPASVRQDVWVLYRWCRQCDDEVDRPGPPGAARSAVQRMRNQTLLALKGESQDPTFSEAGRIFSKHEIPAEFPLDLLNGFAKDAGRFQYRTGEEVETYAYQVAGVVGAMMAPVIGVKNSKAQPHAIAMGNAMQLTNISRDVKEDFFNGRVYLPEEWLKEKGISKTDLLRPHDRGALHEVILKVLDRADELYEMGYHGLKYLPWRSAFAVASAAEIYSSIGKKIRKGGSSSVLQRVYVTKIEKLFLLGKGFFRMIRSRYE